MRVSASACANVALVKYWGKRGDPEQNLPAVGSISISLAALTTSTSVEFRDDLDTDRFTLNGATAPLDRAGRLGRQLGSPEAP